MVFENVVYYDHFFKYILEHHINVILVLIFYSVDLLMLFGTIPFFIYSLRKNKLSIQNLLS